MIGDHIGKPIVLIREQFMCWNRKSKNHQRISEAQEDVSGRVRTLVALNGLLRHNSADSRYAYTFHIISASSHYPDDNWLQRGVDMPLHRLRPDK